MKLLRRLLQIVFAHHIITIKYAVGFVGAELHDNPLGHARAPQVMNDEPAEVRVFARTPPRLAKVSDRFRLQVEHERTTHDRLFVRSLNME